MFLSSAQFPAFTGNASASFSKKRLNSSSLDKVRTQSIQCIVFDVKLLGRIGRIREQCEMKVGISVRQKPDLQPAHRVAHLFLARKQGWNRYYGGALFWYSSREIESRKALRLK